MAEGSSGGVQLLVSPVEEENKTFSLLLPSASDIGISEEEEKTTAAAFVGCVSECANQDRGSRISAEHAKTLRLQARTDSEAQEQAVKVGRCYSRLGDQIDRLRRLTATETCVQEFVDTCVRDQDSHHASDVAFQQFTAIVPEVLECDESGIPRSLTTGRVAALFYLGYELCLAFLCRHNSMEAFMDFMSRLLSYLIRFLVRAGFYSWLRSQGGWSNQLALTSTSSYGSGVLHGALIAIVASCAVIVAIRWFRSSS